MDENSLCKWMDFSILYMPKGGKKAHANQQYSSIDHFLIFQIPRKQADLLQPTAAAAMMADSSRIHANLIISNQDSGCL